MSDAPQEHAEGRRARPRLFLCYGRLDAGELAGKLRSDLEAEGYEVLQDVEFIRAGRPWEHEIERAIGGADAVVAVLSPHAVRCSALTEGPEGPGESAAGESVCLDELSFARSAGKPIVPVMAFPCAMPFSIFRLHFVDMCDWRESDGRYREGLARVTEAVEGALRGEARYRGWVDRLRPWDFAPFMAEKRRGFVGREWLFDEIDVWRAASDERALLVLGDPGAGKSALVAEFVHRNPGGRVLAYHCCQADTRETLRPGRFVRSIAAMTASRLDAYAAALSEPAVEKALSDARSDEDPGSAFEEGILGPLRSLPEPEGGAHLVVVDALDEALGEALAERAAGRRTVVDVLAGRIGRFPAWLRLVATTRKERAVLDRLRGLRAREIDAQDPRNLRDIDRYVAARLETPNLAGRLAQSGRPAGEVAAILAEKSAGNFLYVRNALDNIERDVHSFGRLDDLPPGLTGLYAEFLGRLFPDEASFGKVRPVLEAVAAAFEPLTEDMIARATGLDPEDELPRALRDLSQYVPARADAHGASAADSRERRYAVYHKSLADWLTSPEQRGTTYYVSSRKGHDALARACLAEYERGPAFSRGQAEPDASGPDAMSDYALAHVAGHLAAAGRGDDLAALLTDFGFLQSKVRALGPQALVEDYGLALSPAVTPADADRRSLELIRDAVRLSAHVVADDPAQLAGQLHGRLGGFDEPVIRRLLDDAAPRPAAPWLRPMSPTLAPPGGPLIRTLAGHSNGVNAVAITPDGRAVSGSWDNTLKAWDLDTGECVRTLEGHAGAVSAVAIMPDGGAVSGSDDRTLKLWDLETGECVRTLKGHSGAVGAVATTPDGRAVSGSWDGTLKIWDLETGECLRTLEGHSESVNAVALTPDGRAVSGSNDKTLKVWDLETGECLRTLERHSGSIYALALLPDGRAVSGSRDTTLKVWDLETGKCLRTLEGHSSGVTAVALTPDGRAVSGSLDNTLKVWDLDTGECVQTFEGHSDWVNAVALTPDRRAVSGSDDKTLRVWDLETGECLRTLEGHCKRITAVAVAPDARAVSASRGNTLKVWDLERGECLCTPEGHSDDVTAVAVTPDGRAVSGSHDDTLKVWDIDTGECLRTLEGHSGYVNAVAVTPDGRAVSASEDNTFKVWDPATGECLATFAAETRVRCCAVAPDGRTIVAGDASGRVHFLRLEGI